MKAFVQARRKQILNHSGNFANDLLQNIVQYFMMLHAIKSITYYKVVYWIVNIYTNVVCSYFSTTNVKDEPPDNWDEEEQRQHQQEEEESKGKERRIDRDLEFLIHEVVRDNSLDERLKNDLQNKKSDPKYREMLVSKISIIQYILVKLIMTFCMMIFVVVLDEELK